MIALAWIMSALGVVTLNPAVCFAALVVWAIWMLRTFEL